MKNILLLLFIAIVAYGAQLGGLNGTSVVITDTEIEAYAVDPASLQAQIDAINAILSGGITGEIPASSIIAVTNGVVKGTTP